MNPTCEVETRYWISPRLHLVSASCACVAASAYVYFVDPTQGGNLYPQCLLYRATGFYCAGCGATRALHALLHGRVIEALHDNALFVTLLPVAVLLVFSYGWNAWTQNRWPSVTIGETSVIRSGLAFLALMALFMTARNLPGAPFDLLRPLAAN